jgi:hypothetical protein
VGNDLPGAPLAGFGKAVHGWHKFGVWYCEQNEICRLQNLLDIHQRDFGQQRFGAFAVLLANRADANHQVTSTREGQAEHYTDRPCADDANV